jgi:hypothetical protein
VAASWGRQRRRQRRRLCGSWRGVGATGPAWMACRRPGNRQACSNSSSSSGHRWMVAWLPQGASARGCLGMRRRPLAAQPAGEALTPYWVVRRWVQRRGAWYLGTTPQQQQQQQEEEEEEARLGPAKQQQRATATLRSSRPARRRPLQLRQRQRQQQQGEEDWRASTALTSRRLPGRRSCCSRCCASLMPR